MHSHASAAAPTVVKVNIDYSAKKLTGTLNNTINNTTLEVLLVSSQQNPQYVSLGTIPWSIG